MLMGTRRLYRFADRNPSICIRATSYTHDALVLGNFRRFVAINGALEVDLTGQVNAETAAGRHIGLVGGQMDFMRAANRAPDGRSIIALQSTNRDRTRSRIVARLGDGVVTTPRAEADLVVQGARQQRRRPMERDDRAPQALTLSISLLLLLYAAGPLSAEPCQQPDNVTQVTGGKECLVIKTYRGSRGPELGGRRRAAVKALSCGSTRPTKCIRSSDHGSEPV
jgi:hypothetical protein